MRCLLWLFILALPVSLSAQTANTTDHRFNLHFQTTYVYQYKPAFHSPYEGQNSLSGSEEKQNSLTATLFLGARLWKGACIYVNPELAGGSALSGAFGMGGSTNGETFRVGNPAPTLYLARAYLVQDIPLDNERTLQEDGQNAVQYRVPVNYLRIYIGKYALEDLFDNNDCSNSPRTQFLNWALMNTGSWDYAADVRGYTYSMTAEWQQQHMNYKLAFAALPTTANGAELNTDFSTSYAVNASIARSITINDHHGNIRLTGFYNCAGMGNYAAALMQAPADTPNVILTRKAFRTKSGFAISGDYAFTDAVSGFVRGGWNDGKNETWAFTEIDNTIALGATINAKVWKRPEDVAGIGVVSNGLSQTHKKYLQAGGTGFVLGDGQLHYSREMITEIYYSARPSKLPLWITADYQLALNPGYNKDRGPVTIFSLRLHAEL